MKRSKGRHRRRWGQRWREVEAREFLVAWSESGQPLPIYCRRQGVEYERVRRWRRKLEGEPMAGALELKPVRVVADSQPRVASDGAPMEVELAHGRCIRVQRGFDAEELVRLVTALEQL